MYFESVKGGSKPNISIETLKTDSVDIDIDKYIFYIFNFIVSISLLGILNFAMFLRVYIAL